jgi:hypothetical protein
VLKVAQPIGKMAAPFVSAPVEEHVSGQVEATVFLSKWHQNRWKSVANFVFKASKSHLFLEVSRLAKPASAAVNNDGQVWEKNDAVTYCHGCEVGKNIINLSSKL